MSDETDGLETNSEAPSPRTKVVRGANRAEYRPDVIRDILAAGHLAHVGVITDDGPIVLPMAYGVRDNEILIHGSVANAMLRAGRSMEVCVTVTIVDGLVIARSPLHNSMNYRGVVIRGTATRIDDTQDHWDALKIINDHIAPTWDQARPPSEADLKRTMVLAVPLTEASAKIRAEGPVDDAEDLTGPHWAGVLPLTARWGEVIPSGDLAAGAGDAPASLTELHGVDAHQ